MKTTTYICDTCKKSVSESELIKFEVSITGDICIKDATSRYIKQASMDICKDCLRKKGFVIETPQEKDEKETVMNQNQKTLESKLITFLEDLGVVFEE